MSTDLSIKVIETKPAIVDFNYQEISEYLDSILSKYDGLVFTESSATDCKKTIAELRKGQKSIDEFRKTTKKQLTESVTSFEKQCKTLQSKFEEVIQPLTQQYDRFELDRKEKKRSEIQTIIDSLVLDRKLDGKFASQLLIPEEYFNKGKSIKNIKIELTALANNLKVQQDKEEQDIDLIKTKVELANAQYQLSNALMPSSYVRLLEHRSVAEIELLISSDAQEISSREKKKLEATVMETVEIQKTVEVPEIVETLNAVEVQNTAQATITAVYEITGTDKQLSALEAYLDASNLSWIDRPHSTGGELK